ncbi:MAG TPA: STAS domain-containing protein, partial [Mycobacteriales bacterium]
MQLSEINDDRNVGHVHSIPGVVEFGVEVLPGGQGSLVRVGGELDVATAPLLRMVAHGALAGQPGQVHLHLGEVTFFDSAGLDVLIGLRSAALLAPSVTASRPVRRLIELAGATHL